MTQSAYLFIVIIFAVFLGTVIISNLLAGAFFLGLKQLTRRKVKRLL